jgi:hypothetical protein
LKAICDDDMLASSAYGLAKQKRSGCETHPIHCEVGNKLTHMGFMRQARQRRQRNKATHTTPLTQPTTPLTRRRRGREERDGVCDIYRLTMPMPILTHTTPSDELASSASAPLAERSRH